MKKLWFIVPIALFCISCDKTPAEISAIKANQTNELTCNTYIVGRLADGRVLHSTRITQVEPDGTVANHFIYYTDSPVVSDVAVKHVYTGDGTKTVRTTSSIVTDSDIAAIEAITKKLKENSK